MIILAILVSSFGQIPRFRVENKGLETIWRWSQGGLNFGLNGSDLVEKFLLAVLHSTVDVWQGIFRKTLCSTGLGI